MQRKSYQLLSSLSSVFLWPGAFVITGLPSWLSGKDSACQFRRHKRCGFNPWVGKISWRRKWQPSPVLLPGKSHGRRNLVGYSSWGRKESDMTERLTSLSFFLSFFLENCWCHYSFSSLLFLAVLDLLCFLDAPLIATSRGHSPCLCLAHYCGGLSCFVSKGLSSQSCGFSSGHVWM